MIGLLQELTIKNFAIIPELNLSFEKGMTVLTGETGAGKSIIIDAVGLLVGGRGSSDYIRQGAAKCTLEGLFVYNENPDLHYLLTELGIEVEENTLILQRDIFRSGKNTCRVNGRLINTANLRRIGEALVDIHGQNEHQELMQADRHLSLLDEYGRSKIKALKATYQKAYQAYQDIYQQIVRRRKNEKEFAQRIDMLRFQCNEIEAAQLQVDEEVQLVEERNRLVNYQQIATALTQSYSALQGADSAGGLDQIGLAMSAMADIAELDTDYQQISENIRNSYYLLQDAVGELSRSLDDLEMDENRLNEVENRLELIHQMKHKYGDSIATILAYYAKISQELADAAFLDDQSGELAKILAEKKQKMQLAAENLTAERKKLARQLEEAIHQQLKELYMEKTQFEVRFLPTSGKDEGYTLAGKDHVEFYISTNPGEPLKPLVKIASGGELSRMMLALKTIFSHSQSVTSIIFDEVDTGVSGRVAQAIANKIHQISASSQVLCITHLPQVAAAADEQYHIEKRIVDGRTETTVSQLNDEERVTEIARMLAGSEITRLTLEHARELLRLAQE